MTDIDKVFDMIEHAITVLLDAGMPADDVLAAATKGVRRDTCAMVRAMVMKKDLERRIAAEENE